MSSVVPDGWTGNKLHEICDGIFVGHVGSTAEHYTDSSGVKFIRTGDLKHGKIRVSNTKYITREFHQKLTKSQLNPGDILVSRVGDTGQAALVPKQIGEANCANIIIIKPSSGISSEFLLSNINSEDFFNQAASVSIGSAQSVLNTSVIKNLRTLIPPLPEQKKIASILTSVDKVIENTQKQIDKLQDLKKATMNELLTKGIGHTEFKDSELGRIPKCWEVIKLSGLCSLHYGKSPKEIEDDDGMYPIYGTGGIVGKTNSALHAGKSIVIGRKGSIDNVSFVDSPFWAIDTTYYVEGKNVEMKWLFYRLQYEGLKKYNEASGVPSLSRDTLYSIAIQSPPASEQTQICVILDTVESQISSLDIKLHQTQSLKKSLMQDLLTGKVRVTVN